MKKYSYIIVMMFSIISLSCGKSKVEESKVDSTDDDALIRVTKDQFSSCEMEISTIKERVFDISINSAGKIDVPPQYKVKVTSFLGGYVKSTSLLVGSKVTKGQILLMMESPDYLDLQQSYLEIIEQLKYLKSEYERQKTLFDEKIASQKRYLEAESDYKKAKASAESLRQKLILLGINPIAVENGKLIPSIAIHSPISGDVTAVNINVGMYVAPSDVMLEIVNTNFLHLELSVFEKDIFNLKQGLTIDFSVPQISNELFHSKINVIGKSVEGNNRIINVYGNLDDSIKSRLLSGMFVDAQIKIDSHKALSIPTDALISEGKDNYILVLDSDSANGYVFHKRFVTIGRKSEDWVEIILDDTIKSDTRILIKGVYDLI